jgi:anti-sigma regulatory factor (Ser/Thr protein kinase)
MQEAGVGRIRAAAVRGAGFGAQEAEVSQWRAAVDLPVEPTSAAVARHIVAELLGAWGLRRFVDDLQLIASELVTNVFLHTPKADSVELELLGFDDRVRVSVADGSTIKPVIKELDPSTPTGRGLRLVQELASRWGYEEHQGGKRVWVEIDHPTLPRFAEG